MRPRAWVAAAAAGYAAAAFLPVPARPAGIDQSALEVAGIGGAPAGAADVHPGDTTSTIPERRGLTIVATGDILLHSPVNDAAATYGRESGAAYDYAPMFDRVRETLSDADLALCHLETPLSADDTGLSTYPSFSVPWEITTALASAGYDGCSTASNHTLDRGASGISATLDHLDLAGLAHSGSARSAEEAATHHIYDAHGVQVGHLAYATLLNGGSVPSDQPWLVGQLDTARVISDAAALRAAGAQIVIVSVHWGSENVSEPTAEQTEAAAALLASPDIDLVIGHHAHVVQPIERVNGKWVAYGLGNFLSNQSAGTCCSAAGQDGIVARFHFGETGSGRFAVDAVDFVPTWVEHPTYRILDATDSLSDPALDAATRASLAESLQRTVEVVNRRGANLTAAPASG